MLMFVKISFSSFIYDVIDRKIGLYEVESINNACTIVIGINPNEYFEQFKTCDLITQTEFFQ